MFDTVLILSLCIIFEAFFSGAELALISADKLRLRHLCGSMNRRHRKMTQRFLEEPGQLVSAALVGTNICVVLSSVVTTVALLPRFPGKAELISVGVVAPLVLVFGEIVPKSVFQHFADRWAPRLVVILSYFRLLFLPLVNTGGWLTGVILRAVRIKRQSTLTTREGLRLLISLPSKAGADRITAEEKRMISRVFDFSDATVEQVMVHLSEVTALSADATVEEAAAVIADKRHTRLPIFKERVDRLDGIVHSFDVLRAEPGATLSNLCRPAIYVPLSQPALDTLVRLQREGQHMAVVVDEYGGAVGVVTIDDVLEEIVGEMRDEYDDEPVALIRSEGAGAYRVEGKTPVDRVNQQTRLQLPLADDYETVAGLVLHRLKCIPTVGTQFDCGTATILVTKANERVVEQVRIFPRA